MPLISKHGKKYGIGFKATNVKAIVVKRTGDIWVVMETDDLENEDTVLTPCGNSKQLKLGPTNILDEISNTTRNYMHKHTH